MTEQTNGAISAALSRIATQLKYLGDGGYGIPMGAIEAHGKFLSDAIEQGCSGLTSVLEEQVSAQEDMVRGLHAIADSLEHVANALGIIATTYQLNHPVMPPRTKGSTL
jgi:hypothetical protein